MTSSLRHVFAYTDRWAEVARFYRDVVGLPEEESKSDSVWFAPDGTRLVVHERDDATDQTVARARGFVPWVHVDNLDATFERARNAGSVVGKRYEGYFFVRDPEGRFVGIRRAR